MAKKRNPQDATLRNVRATKKRLVLIEARLAFVEGALIGLHAAVHDSKKKR